MSQPSPPHDAPAAVRVVGHDALRAALGAAAAAGAPPQALLLVGPPAVGKRTLARWLAQALCCTAPLEARPCGTCRACRLVARGVHPDVHLDDERVPLRTGAVLALQRALALAPVEAAWRVAVLGDIELASPGASNSLLKTLEEPPPHAVLVLTATDEDAVLPTIRSRCRVGRLRAAPPESLAAALVAEGFALDDARLAARLAEGRYGRARGLLADPEPVSERTAWLDELEGALAGDRLDRVDLAARAAQRPGVADGLLAWCSWWRDLILVQHGAEAGVTNVDRLAQLRALAAGLGAAEGVAALRACQEALRQLAARSPGELVLEVLLLAFPVPERTAA